MAGEKNGILPGDSGGPELVLIDGALKAVALNHGMEALEVINTHVVKRGSDKGQFITTSTFNPSKYGNSIGTILTEENICWVVGDSGPEIPGVICP